MTLKLNGSSSGYTAIDAPATAGSNTLVLPADNGSNGEFLQTNGSGTLDWAAVATPPEITSVYKVTSDLTSVDQITFGSLPSGIKKLWFVAESITHTSGNEPFRARIGDSGGLHTSGYAGSAGYAGNPNQGGAADVAAWSLGYASGGSGDTNSFFFEMAPVDSAGKKWVANWRLIQHGWSHVGWGGGFCALDTELTQIQFSNNSSSSDFASGSMALHYIK